MNYLKKSLLPLTTLALGLILGFSVAKIAPPPLSEVSFKNQRETPGPRLVTEGELPIRLDLLQNPLIYEWRGSVRGELISKEEEWITLQDKDRNTLIVPLRSASGQPIMTTFFAVKPEPSGPEDSRQVELEEIPLGITLIGDIFAGMDGDRNRVVGGSFYYFTEEQ